MKKRIFRHGDVLIKEIDALPRGLEKLDSNVLAEGEITGHSHRLVGNSQVFQDKKGDKFFKINQQTTLVHQEHEPITIEEGIFEVLIEREYSPFDEEIRTVMD